MPFEALDFYDIDSLLTEEERMVRDMVRDFVDNDVLPRLSMHAGTVFFLMSGELLLERWES